jgi:DNA polymerase-1
MIYLISSQLRLFEDLEITNASIQDCLDYFKDKDIIEVDTETEYNKRNPKHLPNPYESKVLCLQLGDKDNQFIIDPNDVDISSLSILFEDKNKLKILCNSFFDLRFVHHWGFKIKNIYDIFLAEMLLTLGKDMPKGYRGLEQMGERYLGITISKEVRGQIHWRGLDETVIKYAAGDVTYLNNIRLKQLEQIKEYNLEVALDLENRFAIVLSHISYKGFKIDINKWREVYNNNLLKLQEYSLKLDTYLIENNLHKYIDITLFDKRSKVNWASSKQVIPLFQDLGINTETRDKDTGQLKDSVEGKHLLRQKSKFPILPIYLRYKEIQKEISTYGETFLIQNINPITGRVHSEFFQLVDTGRISSSNPNLQNIPATDEHGDINPLRECFVPEEGNDLIVADYSQQEPRITAEYSQDPYLIDFILNGDGDSHSLVSTMISEYLLGEHIKVTRKNNPVVPQYNQKIRDIGKMINLGLDYGKTAYSVKDDLNTTQEEAQKLINIIKAKTPVKQKYFNYWINFVMEHGYIIIDNITKRRSWFYKYEEFKRLKQAIEFNRDKKLYSQYSKVKGELERFAQNYKIQGTGGSMTKLAAIYFYDELEKRDLQNKVWLVNLVHDELVPECNKQYSELVAQLVQEVMIKAGSKFCKTIPMIAEPNIVQTWSK